MRPCPFRTLRNLPTTDLAPPLRIHEAQRLYSFPCRSAGSHSNDNKSVPQSMSADTSEFGGKYFNCLLERPHNAGVRLVYKVFDDVYLDSGVMPIVGV